MLIAQMASKRCQSGHLEKGEESLLVRSIKNMLHNWLQISRIKLKLIKIHFLLRRHILSFAILLISTKNQKILLTHNF